MNPPAKSGHPQARRRGQVAAEFMLYTAVFMLVAVAAFLAVNTFQSADVPLQQNRLAVETGQGFVTALTLAVKGGSGFSYNYTFPKTVFGIPYAMHLENLSDGYMTLEWAGSYGNFSYQYNVPAYDYVVAGNGDCLGGSVLQSSKCSNMLLLYNDGENLTITQLG